MSPGALIGADAVLVTHEYADHIDVLRSAGLRVPVYAPAGAAITGVDFVGVSSGEAFTAAGFPVSRSAARTQPATTDSPAARTWAIWSTVRSATPAIRCTCPGSRWGRCSSRPTRPG
ncbi:hypothetical protein GCM10020366_30330 [Saccharopolyspora gregorii]|uniref:MBL fold metallo-hydrolase n=1 Tax=Saccharopolyspora gregorii TaxID=33914 RepID=A0ABP6RVD8_9PSEU